MSYTKRATYGSVKKEILNLVQNEVNKGKVQFTYTEIHDFILDVTYPNWRKMYSSENESRYEHRGQHTGMFSAQSNRNGSYNVLCSPNKLDSRHLVKIKRGLYEFKA